MNLAAPSVMRIPIIHEIDFETQPTINLQYRICHDIPAINNWAPRIRRQVLCTTKNSAVDRSRIQRSRQLGVIIPLRPDPAIWWEHEASAENGRYTVYVCICDASFTF